MCIGSFMMGDPGHDSENEEPTKVFTLDECLDEVINYFKSNPGAVRNNCIVPKVDEVLFDHTLAPAVTNKDEWDRVSTDRPSLEKAIEIREELESAGYKRPEGCNGSGTDMVVREFDNILWDDYDKVLNVKIVTEFGFILGMIIKIEWD